MTQTQKLARAIPCRRSIRDNDAHADVDASRRDPDRDIVDSDRDAFAAIPLHKATADGVSPRGIEVAHVAGDGEARGDGDCDLATRQSWWWSSGWG